MNDTRILPRDEWTRFFGVLCRDDGLDDIYNAEEKLQLHDEALRARLAEAVELLRELAGAEGDLDARHPMQYGFRDDHAVIGYAPDDATVVDRMNRCPTCEEWSPCSVRTATLRARVFIEEQTP